jgi:hypothetical protein
MSSYTVRGSSGRSRESAPIRRTTMMRTRS